MGERFFPRGRTPGGRCGSQLGDGGAEGRVRAAARRAPVAALRFGLRCASGAKSRTEASGAVGAFKAVRKVLTTSDNRRCRRLLRCVPAGEADTSTRRQASRAWQHMFPAPPDALHRRPARPSDHPILRADAIAVAALVVLAGRLPGHSELGGDLRPPDTQAHGLFGEHR
jgi:hypothetical protein